MNDISPLTDFLTTCYEKQRENHEGEVATYIPELGKADPLHFGISLCTVDGQQFSLGDWGQEFTIQSICKPFAFLMALERHGRDRVLTHVGVEPSGDTFNSVELQPVTNRPPNPMVNAGAIAIASLIRGDEPSAGIDAFLQRMSLAAGRPLAIDEAVMASESATGDRNRAIAYLLRNFDIIDTHVDHTLHQYFAQCSMLTHSVDLAVIGATLANMGTNPLTGEEVFDWKYVRDALATMFTCGMYNFAGEWAYRVGVPAKSGVSGGVLAVVNRQFSLAVYSPRVDLRGNSVRGIQLCIDVAEEFGLHAFDFMNFGSNFIRSM